MTRSVAEATVEQRDAIDASAQGNANTHRHLLDLRIAPMQDCATVRATSVSDLFEWDTSEEPEDDPR